jgi:hypothetical protein
VGEHVSANVGDFEAVATSSMQYHGMRRLPPIDILSG